MELFGAFIVLGILIVLLAGAIWICIRIWLINYAAKKLDNILSKYLSK